MSTTTKTRTMTLAAITLVAVGALAGCSQGAPDHTPAATTVPVAVETAAPTAPAPEVTEPAATGAPVVDEFSQVVNGVLYQGTEKAPVRIGTDAPGQAPAAEAGYLATPVADRSGAAEAAGKYLVLVFESPGDGWAWKVLGVDRWGSFREIADSGYTYRQWLPTRDAALAGPFIVDGRTLDRAEYLLVSN